MRKQPIVLIVLLSVVGLLIAGCRVKSAAEDAEPTESGNVIISYRSDTDQPITDGQDVTQEVTDEAPTEVTLETPTLEPTQTPQPTATNTELPTLVTPGVGFPTNTQAAPIPTNTQQSEVAVLPPTNTPTLLIPSNTLMPTNTPTSIPTNTATPLPTNTSTPTQTPTPLITPTFTPFEAIGGGAPTVVAQDATTPASGLNANQQTATAFWIQATQTSAAAQGTILPASPGVEVGSTPGVPTPAGIGTEVYPDCEHYVDPGATLSQIARLYNNIDINYIASYNNLDNVDYIKAGTYLIIPGCGLPVPSPTPTIDPPIESVTVTQPDPDNSQGPVQYTVQVGDNIYRLSVRFGVTMGELVNANPIITDINLISVGQVITIPRRSQIATTTTGLTPTPTVTPNQGGTVG